MLPRYFLLFVLLLINFSNLYGQKTDAGGCKGESQDEVTAFIKGHQYESFLDEAIFKKDFDLALSDSSYQLVAFTIVWEHRDTIYAERINGYQVPVIEKNYTLKNIDTALPVVFECITIKKGSVVYLVPAFVVYTTNAGRAGQLKKDIIPCTAYISGYKNKSGSTASYTIFSKDLLLELSDPSYKIIDFIVSWDEENGDISSALFQGNKILVRRDARTDLSRKVRRGSTVTIDNIRVEKGGKIYKTKSFVLYLN